MGAPRDYALTFAGAGEREIRATGKYLRVMETPSADVFVGVDGGSELQRAAGQGMHIPEGFSRVVIRTAVAQTVRVSISDAAQDDTRNNVALTVGATVAGSTAATKAAAVSVPALSNVLLCAANPDRQEVRLGIASGQPGGVWFSDAAGQADAEGGFLDVGMVDYVATLSALYAYNPHATLAVVVNVLDMETP